MIEFRCKDCNQKIRGTDALGGKRVKCPKCGIVIIVPTVEKAGADASQSELFFDPAFLDISQKEKALDKPVSEDGMSGGVSGEIEQFEDESEADETEQPARRKFPWIIDIFLYPASKAGLTILGIVIGVPLLIGIMSNVLALLVYAFPPLIIVASVFGLISLVINVVIFVYMLWYVCECIRDSGLGGIRAPETMGVTPGLEELGSGLFKIVGCLVFFFLPVCAYYYYTREVDRIVWLLLGYGIFFSPMGLLAVIMLGSFSGLNPILLIGSIFSTFFPYVGLVLFYCAFGVLVVIIWVTLSAVAVFSQLQFLLFLPAAVLVYLLIVEAHVLGWFYRRYREELYWEA